MNKVVGWIGFLFLYFQGLIWEIWLRRRVKQLKAKVERLEQANRERTARLYEAQWLSCVLNVEGERVIIHSDGSLTDLAGNPFRLNEQRMVIKPVPSLPDDSTGGQWFVSDSSTTDEGAK